MLNIHSSDISLMMKNINLLMKKKSYLEMFNNQVKKNNHNNNHKKKLNKNDWCEIIALFLNLKSFSIGRYKLRVFWLNILIYLILIVKWYVLRASKYEFLNWKYDKFFSLNRKYFKWINLKYRSIEINKWAF